MDPQRTILLQMAFETAFLALAAVFGIGCQSLREAPRPGRALVLIAFALALATYAWRRLPGGTAAWLLLGVAGLFFVVVGYYAGVGFKASRSPSMEEQIEALTGEDADWETLRPRRERPWRRRRE